MSARDFPKIVAVYPGVWRWVNSTEEEEAVRRQDVRAVVHAYSILLALCLLISAVVVFFYIHARFQSKACPITQTTTKK